MIVLLRGNISSRGWLRRHDVIGFKRLFREDVEIITFSLLYMELKYLLLFDIKFTYNLNLRFTRFSSLPYLSTVSEIKLLRVGFGFFIDFNLSFYCHFFIIF